MITYTEKGNGLHLAIEAAGHVLRQHDGEWESSDDVAVQGIIDSYTLQRAKAEKCLNVSLHAKSLRDKAVSVISNGEMASWPIKRAEAEAFNVNPTASCPMLSAEALTRGVPLDALVVKVVGNSDKFSALEATIGGVDGRHRDAIAALTTFEEVATYDFSSGWPEV